MTVPGDYDLSSIIDHYEACLERHGDTAQGMDWPNEADLRRRYSTMAELIRERADGTEILDLGCGSGMFLDFLQAEAIVPPCRYRGIDLSEKMIAVAKNNRAAASFEQRDIMAAPLPAGSADFVVMNGVLTEKRDLNQTQMTDFAQDLISHAFQTARKGLAFNVMSKNVDWERDDLFHWGLDEMSAFLCAEISREFVIRNDYGLYEYTVYVYR